MKVKLIVRLKTRPVRLLYRTNKAAGLTMTSDLRNLGQIKLALASLDPAFRLLLRRAILCALQIVWGTSAQ
jgi:hypothetical protein